MKSILTKIEFHYSFLIIALGLVLTGHFSNLLVFTSLIIIHEFGHIIAALFYHYQIDKIIIYPYGGFTKINCMVNSDIWKDLVVALFGLIMQTLYFGVIYLLYSNGLIREYIYNLFLLYHKSMLIFNIFPIIPLDGFKILNLIFSKFLNFNLSNYLSIFISFIMIIIFLFSDIFVKNYSIVLILGIFFQNIYKFYKEISYVYNRFLLERYLYNISYKKKKIIDNENKMYKNKSHFFVKNGKMMSEKAFLATFFKK